MDDPPQNVRSISTSDIDELAQFQVNKNRRYTQLESGVLKGQYFEINLGDVQIFRENLTTGALIEAAPVAAFVPFAAVLSNSDDFNFCGKKRQKNTILQATGGIWDASFKHSLNFVVAAFNREILNQNLEHLAGHEIPQEWLSSKATLTDPAALNNYAQGLTRIISLIQSRPETLKVKNSQRMLSDSILELALSVLNPTTPRQSQKVSRSNRRRGVRKVIEYLHSYAHHIPTIPELCKIASLSERNLQYGFREYLDLTPIRYLRLVRLNGVRRDLLKAQPKKERVVDIALNWGFIELGRFAGEYYHLFQELPSATLHALTVTGTRQ